MRALEVVVGTPSCVSKKWFLTIFIFARAKRLVRNVKLVELWNGDQKLVYSPSNSNGGHPLAVMLIAVINAAIARAAPNYIPLVQQARARVFLMGPNALPDGPYNTEVKK